APPRGRAGRPLPDLLHQCGARGEGGTRSRGDSRAFGLECRSELRPDCPFTAARSQSVRTLPSFCRRSDNPGIPWLRCTTAGRRPRGVDDAGSRAMKLSARNLLKGRVLDVQKGQTTAHVRIELGEGAVITASVTNEAVDELGLKAGDEATAIIKASDVIVGK